MKTRRFSLARRVLGAVSVFLLLSVLVVVYFIGLGVTTGLLLTASVAGLVVPCVQGANSALGVLQDVLEVVMESVATVIEGVLEFFASLF